MEYEVQVSPGVSVREGDGPGIRGRVSPRNFHSSTPSFRVGRIVTQGISGPFSGSGGREIDGLGGKMRGHLSGVDVLRVDSDHPTEVTTPCVLFPRLVTVSFHCFHGPFSFRICGSSGPSRSLCVVYLKTPTCLRSS